MKKILAIFIITSAFSLTSNAGIHVEPYLGFSAAKIDEKISALPQTSDGLTGVGLGLRVGYSIPFFWGAIDYSTAGSLTSKVAETAGGNSSASADKMGITAGFTLVPMLDLMAGYVMTANLTQNLIGGEEKLKGSGYKLGVGITMLPLVSIIIEYMDISYDNSTNITNASEKGLMVSLSLPLDL